MRRVSCARTKIVVDIARDWRALVDRFLGDFVKHEAMDGNFGLEHFMQVPTDGFSFAVLVRRQIEATRTLEQVFKFCDVGFFVRRNHIERVKIFINIHAEPRPRLLAKLGRDFLRPLRQIADMPNARFDDIAVAEELADSAGFGR